MTAFRLAAALVLSLLVAASARADDMLGHTGSYVIPTCADTGGNHLNSPGGNSLTCGNTSTSSAAIIYTGTLAGGTTAYTMASPSPAGFTLTDQYVVRAKINATNTGASTLAVNGTAATAIKLQTDAGPAALVGGELVANNEYDFVYSSSASAYIVTTNLATGITYNATSATITTPQWANCREFVVTTASQTFTLPASAGLAPNGCVIISAVVATTLAPGSGDSINGGTVNASLTIPAGALSVINTDGAGHIGASLGGGGGMIGGADSRITVTTTMSNTVVDLGKSPRQAIAFAILSGAGGL